MRGRLAGIVLCIAFAGPVAAQTDAVFYDDFETADSSAWWAPARVGETGQVICLGPEGEIPCAGTGQDGEARGGVAWPVPRFVDNGTVTDALTGLIWLKNARCFTEVLWADALTAGNGLASGACGLADGSLPGDWRLPSRFELESLLHLGCWSPLVPDNAGTGCWSENDPFTGVLNSDYWSSTHSNGDRYAYAVSMNSGEARFKGRATETCWVWPVKGAP